jgi:hypothetical protein
MKAHTPESLSVTPISELEAIAVSISRPRQHGESDRTLLYRLQRDSANRYGRLTEMTKYDQMYHQSAAMDYQVMAGAQNAYQNQQLGGMAQNQAAYQGALAQLNAGQFNNALGQGSAGQQWAGLGLNGSSMEAEAKRATVKPPYVAPQIAVERVDGQSRVSIGGTTVIALDDAQEAATVADRLEGASLGMGDEVPVYVGGWDLAGDSSTNVATTAYINTKRAAHLRAGTANNDINQITSIGGTYMIPPVVVEKLGGQSKVGEFFAALNPLRKKSGY